MKKIIKIILLIIATISTTILLSAAIFLFICIKQSPKLTLEKINNKSTSYIYDNNLELIYNLGEVKYEYASINNISKYMKDAVISIEDQRFYEHKGIDYIRLLGASMSNIKSLSFKEGASTINQQLIKNVFLTPEKTIKRKVIEMYLSMKLESILSKEQILESYLNNVLFGNKIYGIESAASYYFNKKASELTLSESALLAGIIQLPNYYNPFKNIKSSISRRNVVLKSMLDNNYISYDEYANALKEEIILNENKMEYSIYSSYIDEVIRELNEMGINPYKSNLKIYTNMDRSLQKNIYDIMNSNLYPKDLKTGIIAIDNNSGKIEGIGGIKGNDFGINYATNVCLQPGSTIKPILDYAPAIEYLNYNGATIMKDDPYTYKNGKIIRNWDNLFKGDISLRKALVESRNIPAVKIFNELNEKSFEFSQNIGINLKEPINESNALGAFKYGYTVKEITNAYQAFANMGLYIKAHTINKVIVDGKIINPYIEKKVAMKKSTAFIINNILHDVIKSSEYNVKGLYLSAKTGQTNYDLDTIKKYNIPSNSTKDSWYVGYSKLKSIGIWCGYDSYNNYLDNYKKNIPRIAFKKIMEKYDNKYIPYEMPNNLILKQIEIHDKAYLASNNTLNSLKKYEYFIKGSEPTSYYDENFIIY